MDKTQASELFATLGTQVRLDIFRLLVRKGGEGMVAGDIAAMLAIAPSNLSFHLKTLTYAGLVHGTQEGRFQRYHANTDLMMRLLHFLGDECCVDASAPSDCQPTSNL
ncbi:metalloregulator ArsR/SmtB family transcription factor [Suttonella sp. R2A3]|uniref:ArsR/SmtB family transcription factor n=1 Tax=Suttonella sp. R2A3 TaxID=2908648 RepID=UPI001F2AA9FE|nr:metalloregulator ArsR/SmtB family transcription factor [Suttonella sp. R2A3]UJF25174.1 metalloregulator ArsR/SmtB family transcription factor [Suttonella sp. R2A3]